MTEPWRDCVNGKPSSVAEEMEYYYLKIFVKVKYRQSKLGNNGVEA